MSESKSASVFSEKTEVDTTVKKEFKQKNKKKSSDHDDDEECGWNWGQYAPLILFIILAVIVLLCFGCWNWGDDGCNTNHIACFLFFIFVWILVLWFFCQAGNAFAAWFFFLLPIAVIFLWAIAGWLGNLACSRRD